MMKISLIGPTYPFRGGISHYTTLLYRHLKKRHDTTFFAFKRQYPKWLYPGETDRDSSDKPLFESNVNYILDSLNPFSWIRLFNNLNKTDPDLVIFPWWTSFWTVPFICIILLIKSWTEAKILFICHNVKEHESTFMNRLCTKLVLGRGDLHLVHSREDRLNLAKILPGSIIIQGFHPTYEKLQGRRYRKKDARRKLNVNGKVLLFFGFVRPYKGLIHLLSAMPTILEQLGPDLLLMIVGECWEEEQEYRKKIRELGIEKHILRINKYIPNEQISLYFSASDLVVIPYISATGSGILQVAFGCKKPVVATRVGGLTDDITDGKTGYLVAPADPKSLAAAIVKFFMENKSDQFSANIIKTKKRFSWERMVDLIETGTRNVP